LACRSKPRSARERVGCRRSGLLAAGLLLFALWLACAQENAQDTNGRSLPEETDGAEAFRRGIGELHAQIGLQGVMDEHIFELAMIGYLNLKRDQLLRSDTLLTIVDYRKTSKEKRLYVVDLKRRQLRYHTLVAHGKGSGASDATRFSNTPGSKTSSLGFFLTGEPYFGVHGYSLKLKGLEESINDNAEARSIVIHGAAYVSEGFIERYGRLGRSWGCPALPVDQTREIIDAIKGGSCLFVYGDDPSYLAQTRMLDLEAAARQFRRSAPRSD
jgi:hypothetical protein